MELDHEGIASKFKVYVLLLAGTNAVQFLVYFFIVFPSYNLFSFYAESLIGGGLLLILLIVDLFVTLQFLRYFTLALHKEINHLLLFGYGVTSLLVRLSLMFPLFVSLNIYWFPINYDDGSIEFLLYLIGIVSILFAANLFSIVDGQKFVHDDKIKTIMWANFTGITVFFGPIFVQIFAGIKLFLPLPAALVYFLLAGGIHPKKPKSANSEEFNEDELEDTLFLEEEDLLED